MKNFQRPAVAVYGHDLDLDAIRCRYGGQIGLWGYYLKNGAGRLAAGVAA